MVVVVVVVVVTIVVVVVRVGVVVLVVVAVRVVTILEVGEIATAVARMEKGQENQSDVAINGIGRCLHFSRYCSLIPCPRNTSNNKWSSKNI
jgi:hypothetical protein